MKRLLLVLFVVVVWLSLVTLTMAADRKSSGLLTIAAVGDIMMGSPEFLLPPKGGKDLLKPAFEALKADITFGNLEGALTGHPKRRKKSFYCFRTPPEYVANLTKAGFTALSLANNHAHDYGAVGYRETIRTLKKAGIVYSGPPGSVAKWTVKGRKLAMIAFAPYLHSNDLNKPKIAANMVRRLHKKGYLVIVSIHGGAEGSRATRTPRGREYAFGEDRGDLRAFARAVIDAGAGIVIGHGPHVLRGLEIYKGKLIAYSLGNFCTHGGFNLQGVNGLAAVLRAKISKRDGRFISGRIVPFYQARPGGPKKDPQQRAIKLMRRLTKQDFPDTGPIIEADGTVLPRRVKK